MRAILFLLVTTLSLLAMIVLVIGVGIYRIRAADRNAHTGWVAPPQTPTTAPIEAAPPVQPDSAPDEAPPPPQQPRPIILFAIDCKLRGPRGAYASTGLIENWRESTEYVEWKFVAAAAGHYNVLLTYSLPASAHPFTIEVAGQTLQCQSTPTAAWNVLRTDTAGAVELPAGPGLLQVKPVPGTAIPNGLMHLRSVCLVPAGMTLADPAMAPITLEPVNAALHGANIKLSEDPEPRVVNWTSPDDWLEWSTKLPQRGMYRVDLTLSNAETTGGDFEIIVAREPREHFLCHAGTTGDFDHPRTATLGPMMLPAGRVTLEFRPKGKFRNALMNVWKVVLVPQ